MLRRRAWRTGVLLAAVATVTYLTFPEEPVVVSGKAQTSITRLLSPEAMAAGGGRVEAWQVAIPIIQQNLALGHGFGTEELIFSGLRFKIHRGSYVHNSYLGLTYQLGLVGSILLFGPLLWLLARRAFARPSGSQLAAYEAVLFGGLIASLFESWIYSAGNAFSFPFWICVMLLIRGVAIAPVPIAVPARATARRATPAWYLPWHPRPALLQSGRKQVQRFDPPAARSAG
jgi:hypothetical protein